MPEQSIIIKFQAKGNKKLEIALENLDLATKKLKGETNKLRQQGGLLGTSFDRNRKSATLLGNAFATMRSKLLLVNFAMGLGITQLVRFAQEAARVKNMETAFNELSGGVSNADVSLQKLRQATNGTMSSFDLFQQANNAMILGVTKNSDEMAEMFDMAQRLGRALGRDTASSVESLITGIGRQSRLMLDNIGIIVKSDEAYQSYAKEIGKSVSNLSDAEKKQAFFNATLESARQKLQSLPEETLTTQDKFDQLSSSTDELAIAIGKSLDPVLSSAATKMTTLVNAVTEMLTITEDEKVQKLTDSINDQSTTLDIQNKVLDESTGFFTKLMIAMSGLSGTLVVTEESSKKLKDSLLEDKEALHALLNEEKQLAKFKEDSTEKANLEAEAIEKNNKAKNEANRKLLQEIELLQARKDNFGNELGFLEAEIEIMQKQADALGNTNEAKKLQLEIDNKQLELDKKRSESLIEETIRTKLLASSIDSISSALADAALNGDHMGRQIEKALKRIAAQILAKAGAFALLTAIFPGAAAAAGLKGINPFAFALGLNTAHTGGLIKDNKVQKFATGGVVQGEDNVPILAQNDEFVMSRNAVESVGIETMNRINQTGSAGVTVNVSGNVMSQDFVEGELAERIKEAVRKGSNFGMS